MLARMSLSRLLLTAVAAVGGASLCETAHGSEALREAVGRLASAIQSIAKARGVDALSIGEFTGPPSFGSSAGPGIRRLMIEELGKHGIREKTLGAALGVQGKYLLDESDGNDAQGNPAPRLKLQVALVDKTGKVIAGLQGGGQVNPDPNPNPNPNPRPKPIPDPVPPVPDPNPLDVTVFGSEDDASGAGALAETLGATVDFEELPNRIKGADTERALVLQRFENPRAVIRGGVALAASPSSPFEMEILVNNRPQPLRLEDGHAYVGLDQGTEFQVAVRNRKGHKVSVQFLLDGISSFAFSEIRFPAGDLKAGEPRFSRFILSPSQRHTLLGWHRDNSRVDSFKITNLADSAAARLGAFSRLGTITVAVHAAWLPTDSPPAGEPIARLAFAAAPSVGAAAPDSAVGFGDERRQEVQESKNKHEIGQPRAVLTIRYQKPEPVAE